jgi:hypothetical protein
MRKHIILRGSIQNTEKCEYRTNNYQRKYKSADDSTVVPKHVTNMKNDKYLRYFVVQDRSLQQ